MRILKNNLKYIFCILAVGLIIDTGLLSKNTANAEWNSSKPIKVFVGFKPGGRTDVLARLISNYINKNKLMAHPIAIVNKPGAAAANAARAVLKAKPDGHTLLHWHHQMLIANAMGVNKIHPNDFTTIGYTGGGSPVWAVRKDFKFNTINELITESKNNPRSLVEAVPIGTIPHLVGVMLKNSANFETKMIGSVGGSADRLQKVLGNNADIALFSAAGFLKHQASGLKALVFFGPKRINVIKDVPTAKELGYDAVWANPASWLGPKGMSKEITQKWASALKQAINSKEIKDYYSNNALDPYWTPGDEALQDSLNVLDKLQKVVKENKISKKS